MPVTIEDVNGVNDWDSLARVAHAMAVEKGWWDTERPRLHIWTNFVAEAMEAWEEYRAGRMETWIGENGKPEGYWAEIADVLIRIADYAGSGGPYVDREHSIAYAADELPMAITRMCVNFEFGAAVAACFATAEKIGVDLGPIIRQKMQYNLTRSHRHGGKIA